MNKEYESLENLDRFVYHLTIKQNLKYISKFGLIPTYHQKNRYTKVDRNFVYFTNYIEEAIAWKDKYYFEYNKEDLVLLRFKLIKIQYFSKDFKGEDFYTWCDISKNDIEILENLKESEILNENNKIKKKLIWKTFKEGKVI